MLRIRGGKQENCRHTLATETAGKTSNCERKRACAKRIAYNERGCAKRMTKYEVLAIFAETGGFVIPDDVRIRLEPMPDRRSIYSYLGRLARQGLLERGRTGWGGSAESGSYVRPPPLRLPLPLLPPSHELSGVDSGRERCGELLQFYCSRGLGAERATPCRHPTH